jgi:hypothetical protein
MNKAEGDERAARYVFMLCLLSLIAWLFFSYHESISVIREFTGRIAYMESLQIPYVYNAELLDEYCYGEGWKKESEIDIPGINFGADRADIPV